MATNKTCVACKHQIDASAKLCPYCGADPNTGQKVDTQAILQEVFQAKQISTTEGVLQFARQRQGIVVTLGALAALLVLAGIHQFAVRRNQSQVNGAAAVPLTEITDLTSQPNETRQLPMPALQFQFEGKPQTMRTFVIEPGAIPPPGTTTAAPAVASPPPPPAPATQPR